MAEKTRRTRTEIFAEPALGSASRKNRKPQREPSVEPPASARPLSKEEGKRMLDKALQLVANLPPSILKAETQADLASVMQKAEIGGGARNLFEEAMKFAEDSIRTSSEGWRLKEYIDLAMGIKKAEDAPKRTKFSYNMWPIVHHKENTILVLKLAEAGRAEEALRMASHGLDTYYSPNVAMLMAKAGKFDEALSLASSIDSPSGFFRCKAEIKIASEMIKAGMFERAMPLFPPVNASGYLADEAIIIVSELAKAGKFKEALEYSSGMAPPECRAKAYAHIASEMAKAGMGKESKAMFRKAFGELPKIKYENERKFAQCTIALALANAFLAIQTPKQEG